MNNKDIILPHAHSWCKHLISVDFEFACPTFACHHILKDPLINMHVFQPNPGLLLYMSASPSKHALQHTCSLMWCVCLHVQPRFSSARGRGSAIFIMSSGIHYFLFLHLSFTRSHTYIWCDWVGKSILQYYSRRVRCIKITNICTTTLRLNHLRFLMEYFTQKFKFAENLLTLSPSKM